MRLVNILGAVLAALGALGAGWVVLQWRHRVGRWAILLALLALVLNLILLLVEVAMIAV